MPSKHWCEGPEINKVLNGFHQRHAQFPEEEMKKAKDKLGGLLPDFRRALSNAGIHFEDPVFVCAGSAHYEKAHIARWDGLLELDMELVMKVTDLYARPLTKQACAKVLEDGRAPKWLRDCGFYDDQGRLSAERVLQKFLDALKTVPVGNEITFVKCGPAVTMQVFDGGERWFNVDLVPVIHVLGVGSYVPKQKACGLPLPFAWRESFTTEEREYFRDEKKWHHARHCLRIMKAFASHHYALRDLKSYAIKNVFIMELEQNPDPAQWTEKTIGRRVMDLLVRLRDCLKVGIINPVKGDDSINLLGTQRKKALKVMHKYVEKVCKDQKAFMYAFNEAD